MWAHQPSVESSQQLYFVPKVMAGIAKSTTTPAHMTTLYTVGLTKAFHSPHRKSPSKRPNPSADQPHEQCSHPPPPCSRAKWGKREPSQSFQARQENRSPKLQCVRYLPESQSDTSSLQQPLQCSTQLQDMTGTARLIRRAPTKQ